MFCLPDCGSIKASPHLFSMFIVQLDSSSAELVSCICLTSLAPLAPWPPPLLLASPAGDLLTSPAGVLLAPWPPSQLLASPASKLLPPLPAGPGPPTRLW